MKTITTIEEIKSEAEKDSRASLYVTLNKPVVIKKTKAAK